MARGRAITRSFTILSTGRAPATTRSLSASRETAWPPERSFAIIAMARTVGTSSAPAASYQTQPVLTAVIAERRAANSLRDAAVAMAARATRKAQMHKKSIAVIVPALFAAAVFLSTDASATRVTISGTVSRTQLKKDCDAVGGACGNCSGTTGGYSCINIGPGGKGQTVTCSAGGKCTGVTRRRSNPSHTIGGFLHPPSAGIKSSGGTAPPRSRHRPVSISAFRPPSRMKTTGGNNTTVTIGHDEHHSGGHR